MTGLDQLNDDQKSDIILKSKSEPSQKMAKYVENMKLFYSKEEGRDHQSPMQIKEEWGLSFFSRFQENEGKVLSQPSIRFGNRAYERLEMRNGRFRQQKVSKAVSFGKGRYLVICPNRANYYEELRGLEHCSRELGVGFEGTKDILMIKAHNSNDAINEIRENELIKRNQIKCIFLMFDNYSKNWYSPIKRLLNCEIGIPSQGMLLNKRKSPSYYSGILNQQVIKNNGELFDLKISDKFMSTKDVPYMIIGISSSKSGS